MRRRSISLHCSAHRRVSRETNKAPPKRGLETAERRGLFLGLGHLDLNRTILGDLAINHIVPVATRYQSLLVDNVVKLKTIFPEAQGLALTERDRSTIEKLSEHMSIIKEETERMVNARKAANAIECEREKAIAYHDNVVPAMEIIRYHIDKLELMVDNEMWPLPKYREMLFIR